MRGYYLLARHPPNANPYPSPAECKPLSVYYLLARHPPNANPYPSVNPSVDPEFRLL